MKKSCRTLLIVLLGLLIIPVAEAAASNEETKLFIQNPGQYNTLIQIDVYDANNQVVLKSEYEVTRGETLTLGLHHIGIENPGKYHLVVKNKGFSWIGDPPIVVTAVQGLGKHAKGNIKALPGNNTTVPPKCSEKLTFFSFKNTATEVVAQNTSETKPLNVNVTHRDESGTIVKTQEYTIPPKGTKAISDPKGDIGEWATVHLSADQAFAAVSKVVGQSITNQLYQAMFGPGIQESAPMRYPVYIANDTWSSTGYMANGADTVRDGVYSFNNPATGMAVDSNLVNDLGSWAVAELKRYGGSLDWYNFDVIQYDSSSSPYEYAPGVSQVLMQRNSAVADGKTDAAGDLAGFMGYSNVGTGPYLAGVVPVGADIDKQTLYIGVASDSSIDNRINVQLFDKDGAEVWSQEYTLKGQARGLEIDLTPHTSGDTDCYSLLLTSRPLIGSTIDDIYGVLVWGSAAGDQAVQPLTAMNKLTVDEDEELTYYIPLLEVTLPYLVKGQGVVIPFGDDAPDTADGTDFGNASSGGVTERTFTIAADANADAGESIAPSVALDGGANFEIVSEPSAFTAPDGSTTFTVRFKTTEAGTFNDVVKVFNGDGDTSPYTFAIKAASDGPLSVPANTPLSLAVFALALAAASLLLARRPRTSSGADS